MEYHVTDPKNLQEEEIPYKQIVDKLSQHLEKEIERMRTDKYYYSPYYRYESYPRDESIL